MQKLYNFLFLCMFGVLCISINSYADNSFIKTYKLPNGLSLITYKNSKVPLVAISIVVKGGSVTETPQTNGLTHLWEHMFFKGSELVPKQNDFIKYMRKIGASWNGYTSNEFVNYYIIVPSSFLEEGLKIMAYAIAKPKIDEEELAKERKVVEEEYNRTFSSPKNLSYYLSDVLIAEDSYYLLNVIGKREVIQKASRQQLLDIKDKIMVSKNAALIITGDFDESKIFNTVQKYFNIWQTPLGWKEPEVKVNMKFNNIKDITMIHPEFQTAEMFIYFAGPSVKFDTHDTYVADVFTTMINSKISKAYKNFIESSLTQTFSISYYTKKYYPVLSIYISANTDKIKTVQKRVFDEINKWNSAKYFSQKELNIAKNKIVLDYKLKYDKPSSMFETLGFWWAVAGLDYYQTYLDNIKKVSLDDIQNIIKKYFINKNYIILKLIPQKDATKYDFVDNAKPIIEKYGLGL